ncbi:putative quinol monooxygenase [Flavihumibacter petaseus]|uniref:ABM domain-containing protein n=1 Tax=Flavihumibacter petaseus NBRC 106054 TaxID=1220578 RepID=A0A0E9N2M1_9BACT|nr:putative quinol monooxygenase [Flavihumibacter petaseus]GAO44094.1 hypothetical protein FPE01S_03_01340 [Flavihumibacter petaseus NBRC 106054]
MNIYLTAIITAKPEHHQEVLAVLQNMVSQSRKEEACIQYDLHQGTENPDVFIFYEIWKSKEGLAAHNQQPYILEFGRLVPEKLQEPPAIYLAHKI